MGSQVDICTCADECTLAYHGVEPEQRLQQHTCRARQGCNIQVGCSRKPGGHAFMY